VNENATTKTRTLVTDRIRVFGSSRRQVIAPRACTALPLAA
jgi:hypothetical protein